MKKIVQIAKDKGIHIPSWRLDRVNNMRYALPDIDIRRMSKDDLIKYIEACWCCGSEHAGGYDGWSNGHELLKELGFVEHRIERGHRVFVSMKYARSIR